LKNRLLELAQEAEQSANLGNAIDIKLMMKNYAQLIIEECAQVCNNIDAEYEGEDVLATWCASAIKEHFGDEVKKCCICGTTEDVEYVGGYQAYRCSSPDCIPF
jgi:hypothetical protein